MRSKNQFFLFENARAHYLGGNRYNSAYTYKLYRLNTQTLTLEQLPSWVVKLLRIKNYVQYQPSYNFYNKLHLRGILSINSTLSSFSYPLINEIEQYNNSFFL